jgi:hypothetical protein
MFDSSSGGSRPSRDPSAVSRWEDDRGEHDDHTTLGAQRKHFLATDHDPQYDSPGRALVNTPGRRV